MSGISSCLSIPVQFFAGLTSGAASASAFRAANLPPPVRAGLELPVATATFGLGGWATFQSKKPAAAAFSFGMAIPLWADGIMGLYLHI